MPTLDLNLVFGTFEKEKEEKVKMASGYPYLRVTTKKVKDFVGFARAPSHARSLHTLALAY